MDQFIAQRLRAADFALRRVGDIDDMALQGEQGGLQLVVRRQSARCETCAASGFHAPGEQAAQALQYADVAFDERGGARIGRRATRGRLGGIRATLGGGRRGDAHVRIDAEARQDAARAEMFVECAVEGLAVAEHARVHRVEEKQSMGGRQGHRRDGVLQGGDERTWPGRQGLAFEWRCPRQYRKSIAEFEQAAGAARFAARRHARQCVGLFLLLGIDQAERQVFGCGGGLLFAHVAEPAEALR